MDEVTYELRDLQSKDIFPMVKIINKIGVKEFKNAIESSGVIDKIGASTGEDGTIDISAVGVTVVFELATVIMEHLPDAENEIYGLLESLSGLKRKQLESMGMIEFVQMIVDVIQKPEFKDFTRVASKFIK